MTSATIVAQHVRRTSLAKRYPGVLMGSLGVLAVVLSFYSLSVGATEVSMGDVFDAVLGNTTNQEPGSRGCCSCWRFPAYR